MITESITIQGLHVISLALTPIERWEAARGLFDTDSSGMTLLTGFATVALIISVILLFWVFAKHRRSEHRLNLKITELTITNVKLRQENAELTTTNEKLRQENTELYQKHIEVLENIAENPKEVNPSVKPSRN
jgi:cell division protein FtsB